MKKIFCVPLLCLGISAGIFAAAHSAHAALGELADSITSDCKSLSAERGATTARDGYTIQTIKSEAATVREYLSPSGVVFGIAWNGMSHPDLMPLLGSYAGEYEDALRQTTHKPGRRHLQVKSNHNHCGEMGTHAEPSGSCLCTIFNPSGGKHR